MPLHPIVVHFPIALTFIMPVIFLVFAYLIKQGKMNPVAWVIVIGLQLTIVASAYISLETGETDEDLVEKVLSKDLIHEHEEAAEIFTGVAVVIFVLSVFAFFIRKEFQFYLKLAIVLIAIVNCYLIYNAAHRGGELVYRYSAAGAHIGAATELKSPGQKGIQEKVEKIIEENESYKSDEFDYGNQEEGQEDEDHLKQED